MTLVKIGFWLGKARANPKYKKIAEEEINKLKKEIKDKTISN